MKTMKVKSLNHNNIQLPNKINNIKKKSHLYIIKPYEVSSLTAKEFTNNNNNKTHIHNDLNFSVAANITDADASCFGGAH